MALSAGRAAITPLAAQPPAKKPKLPPGRDPGGVAVAIVGAGLDYTHPEIVPRLARDGEGELIGWDFIDDDNRPFERAADQGLALPVHAGSEVSLELIRALQRCRLIPMRVPDRNATALGRALAMVARTPARIAVVLAGGEPAGSWTTFVDAGRAANSLLIVASAAPFLRDLPASDGPLFGLEALLLAGAGDDRRIGLRLPTNEAPSAPGTTMDAIVRLDNLMAVRAAARAADLASRAKGIWPGAILKQRLIESYRT